MDVDGHRIAKARVRFAIYGRRANIIILAFLAGVAPFLALGDESPRSQLSKRCEVKSVTFSPDGAKIAAFVTNGHESGFSDSRTFDVSYSVVLLNSGDLSKVGAIPLDHIDGPQEPWLVSRNGVAAVVDLRVWYKSMAFSHDGKSLYVVDPKVCQIRTWNIGSASWANDYPIHVAAFGFSLSEKGGLLAAAIEPKGVRIWDTDSGRELLYRADWGPIWNWGLPEFSPDGERFAIATSQGVQLRSVEPEKLLETFLEDEMTTKQKLATGRPRPLQISCLAFSPDEKSLAIGTTKGARICSMTRRDSESPSPAGVKTLSEPDSKAKTLGIADQTRGLAYSPNGKQLAAWGVAGLHFYDASNNQFLKTTIHYTTTLCMAFSPDGKTYAVGDSEGNLTVFEEGTDKKLRSAQF
jgi:WD40 repeat protein